jgi:hypothetical protein
MVLHALVIVGASIAASLISEGEMFFCLRPFIYYAKNDLTINCFLRAVMKCSLSDVVVLHLQ